MLLLTGANGLIGSALLRRLTSGGVSVRCLVRDPRRLGAERVRVQIAVGDLADPRSFRHALRGVDTVVHAAGPTRDQRRGSIEELDGVATWRLIRASESAGVHRFLLLSTIGASRHSGARILRARALAERAVASAGLEATVLACSLGYSPGDRWLTLLERLALLPVVPIPASGRALHQPIWAEDVADCALAALARADGAGTRRYELAGPEMLSPEAIVRVALRSFERRRPLLRVPQRVARGALRGVELLAGPAALATWDEAELLGASTATPAGTADAVRLGVRPRSMRAVLGIG